MSGGLTFKLHILNPSKTIYQGEVSQVQCMGDETEYELLAYHSPLLGVLKRSSIVIDDKLEVSIDKGLVKFFENECVIIAEEYDAELEEEKQKYIGQEYEKG